MLVFCQYVICINIFNCYIVVLCIFTSNEIVKNGRCISPVNAPTTRCIFRGIVILKSLQERFQGIQFVVCFRYTNYFYILYIVYVDGFQFDVLIKIGVNVAQFQGVIFVYFDGVEIEGLKQRNIKHSKVIGVNIQ